MEITSTVGASLGGAKGLVRRIAPGMAGALLLIAAGCAGGPPSGSEADEVTAAISGSDAVARAEQWVAVDLPYCQAANHQRDYDDACSTYCNRVDNPQWDPYRSDCSGLISWSWGLPAPGRITTEFAPFLNDISRKIYASQLAPGDAVNNSDHIMLFKAWVTPNSRATFIEEPGCATAITYAHEFTSDVSVSGYDIYVSYRGMNFTAIRYTGGGGGSACTPGGLYCGGDKLSGNANTLYRCNGADAPTVVETCSEGCMVRPGQDDACRTGGGSCVAGGLYCGGDKVSGDKNTLYRCESDGSASVVEVCSQGCAVRSGQDDACQAPASGGGGCTPGGLYCGGDKVTGNANTLYRCNGTGAPSIVQVCSGKCTVRSGQDDVCESSGNNCVAGGLYCGGDKVSGDPSTLYRCNGSGAPSIVETCSAGCEVRSGQNDACRAAPACTPGGLYCGGDKVSGNRNTLYRCNASGAPTAIEACANGCAIRSGQNDACEPAGSCVVGGLYCGGDKLNGNADTLYRCNGSSAPTAVTRCASGCAVLSGQNDACR